jgi:hypothetical protein
VADGSSAKQYALCLVLGVLLGPLGLHRCYVGRWPTGLLQALGTVAAGAWLLEALPRMSLRWDDWRVGPVIPPLLALFAWGLWPVANVGRLLAGRFRDATGAVLRP